MNTGPSNIPPRYICINCNSIYVNVVQADCGCRYCSLCLDELLKSKIHPIFCITCKDKLSKNNNMFDKAFQKELNNISIDCIKCKWKGKLCEYRLHYDKEHPSLICDHCNKKFLESKKLNSHLNNDECLLKQMKCPFSGANCDKIVTKSTLDQHLKSNVHLHLQNMYNHVNEQITKIEEEQHSSPQTVPLDGSNSQKRTIATKTLDTIVETPNNLTTSEVVASKREKPDKPLTKDKQPSKIDTDLAKFNIIESEQKVVEKEVSIQKQLNKLMKEDISYIKNKEKKLRDELDQLNKSLSAAHNSITSFELRLLTHEKTSYGGVLIWKITNVLEKMLEARNGQQTSIFSQPFYTTLCGYKMCGRVYLNGDGVGRGTYLSLFFSIMKGEYDALLKWPFRQKVTFILIDQSTKKENITDAFRPDPNSFSFKKPTSEMNVASGIPQFCALTKLLANDHEYIKDDTLYIKIVVDIRDLVDI